METLQNKRINHKKNKLLVFIFSLIYALNFSFIGAYAQDKSFAQGQVVAYSPKVAAFDTLIEARTLINNYYIEDVKDKIQNAKSIDEMVTALEDPYSSYFTKAEFDSFINSIDNKFTGIGIYLDIVEEGVKVLSTIEDSPAMEVGIEAGDIIISADGISLGGKSAEEASGFLKGVEGTTVKVVVKRGEELLNFEITRKAIIAPTVASDVLKDTIGYIRISSFGDTSAYEFWDKLKKLEEKNVNSYIIDLRYNGGGYVDSALDIGGHFLGDKAMVIMEDNNQNKFTYYGTDYSKTIEKPIIFLVNEYSASASEILAASVKDYGKAFFIGKTTYGKGVAQNFFPLSDGSYLKLTTFKFFSPKGSVIQDVGVTPNLQVTEDEDSFQLATLILSNIKNEGKLFNLNSKITKEIIKSKSDKTVNITFNREIDESTVSNQNIELVSGDSGENIPVDFSIESGRKIVVTLEQGFEKEGNYYFLVNDKIKSKEGKALIEGAVVKIIVK